MTQSAVITPQEVAEALIEYTVLPERSKFSRISNVFVYEEPLRASREVLISGESYVNSDGVIEGLNLPEQVMLLRLLSERLGIPLRHGSLQEHFQAVYLPDGRTYRDNVLSVFTGVYTGEMLVRLRGTYSDYKVGRIKEVESIPPSDFTDHAVFEEETTQTIVRYKLGPVLQTEIPWNHGYFDQFQGVIPVDSELKPERGKGLWAGVDFADENYLFAVVCYWNSDGQNLNAVAANSTHNYESLVVGVWTDETVKKIY